MKCRRCYCDTEREVRMGDLLYPLCDPCRLQIVGEPVRVELPVHVARIADPIEGLRVLVATRAETQRLLKCS